MASRLEFWFEFGSTYSYLSIMRIEAEAEGRGVETVWKPFLLGPIFERNGWATSPFNIYPAKGRYMWRDMERRARKYGIPFNRPDDKGLAAFPRNGILAARVALLGLDAAWGRPFCMKVFSSQFADGADISEPQHIRRIAEGAGAPADILDRATVPANKERLRTQVHRATELGIFGAPSFVADRELFWGDDRMEDAIDFAAAHA